MAKMSWAAGTQCVAKGDHRKPKPEELFYHKGDILTIIHTSTKKGFYRVRHNSSGEEGLINSTNVREREALRVDPGLSFMPWFHGKISGPEAVCKLQPAEEGLFLVRESIRHPGDYVLCVSVSRDVVHYRVIYQDNKLTIDNTQFFYNLIDMIEVDQSACRGPPISYLAPPVHSYAATDTGGGRKYLHTNNITTQGRNREDTLT